MTQLVVVVSISHFRLHFMGSVAFSRHLASGSGDHTVRAYVWDVATGALIRQLNGHTAGVETIAFSADGCHLASGDCIDRDRYGAFKNSGLTLMGMMGMTLTGSLAGTPPGVILTCGQLHFRRTAIISPPPQVMMQSTCGILPTEAPSFRKGPNSISITPISHFCRWLGIALSKFGNE